MTGKSNRKEQHLPEEESEGALGNASGIKTASPRPAAQLTGHLRDSAGQSRVPGSATWHERSRFRGSGRGNDIRAVTSLPHLQSEEGGPEPQLSESRALSKETPARSAPPAMGCGPVCCVALCLLAAGGCLHRGEPVFLA